MSKEAAPRAHGAWFSLLPLTLAAGAASAITAAYVLGVYLPSFNTPRTALAGVPHPPARPAPPALARRVMLAMMDGLSFDLAHDLDELSDLRAAGAMRVLDPPFPTYTSPALVSFVTGLDPRDHGIRLNGQLTGVFGLDTVTRAAHDAGLAVTIARRGWEPFEEVMNPWREPQTPFPLRASPDAEVIPGWARYEHWMWERETGRAPERGLDLVYLPDADDAGHVHGAASSAYIAAAHRAGRLVERLARTLDLTKDALVIVSDHAHRAEGGHGGVEPEVRRAFFLGVGKPFQRGVTLDPRTPRDVASTLSLLAGLRVPTSNLGRPMLDALDLDDPARARAFAGPFAQAAHFACAIRRSPRCEEAGAITARLEAGDGAALAPAEALLDTIEGERVAENAQRASMASGGRWIAGALSLAFAGAVVVQRRREALRGLSRAMPIVLVHGATYVAVMGALGYRASFSSILSAYYNRHTSLAGSAALLATLLFAFFARPDRLAPWVLLLGTFLPVALLAAFVGANHAVLPPPAAGAVLLILAPVVLSASAASIAVRALAAARRD
ncbi:alkaline phosphatase family protein [Polyangium aurulentum]|uniref:alkaline phosphatase family protein n=1 Tax=Polyangium aurulentum TaxID=2567896 RepID=UPI0010ADBB10|nr:alkaline phosphatase family protein [Polyangium aurulentum]UQA62982.1 alkaline phosphatase family protein [Polyangium aurulentum]